MLKLVKSPWLKYIKARCHQFIHAIKNIEHESMIFNDRNDKVAILGCSCDKVFWLRPDVNKIVEKEIRRQAQWRRDCP